MIPVTGRKPLIAAIFGVFLLALAPLNVQAAQIESVSLQKSSDEQVITVQLDEPLQYQVFDLEAPPRLVLNFPKAGLKAGVQPIRDDAPGVTGIFPLVSKDGARLEISLGSALTYRIKQEGNEVKVRFQSQKTGSGKNRAGAEVQDLRVHDTPKSTELIIRGRNMNANRNAFLINGGKTLILDLWGASSRLPREHFSFASRAIQDVTVGRAEGRLRLVIDLVPGGAADHQITASPSQLTLRIGKITAGRKAGGMRVEEVGFEPEDRVAHIIIRTDQTDPVINLREKKGYVVIDVKKAKLAKGLERSLDVSQFPGPIRQIDAYGVRDNVRIIARLREKAHVSSFQSGNVLTVNFIPEDLARAAKGAAGKERFTYTGQKVTFDFKDIDIRNALKLIAEMSNLNIIMSDDVKGTLTMRLINVPWDQALDLILRARGLGSEKLGNVVRIAPMAVIQAENESKLQSQKDNEQLEPLKTEIIALNYARVEDIKKMIDEAKTARKAGASAKAKQAKGNIGIGLLSLRGSFLIDQRTNTLIIKDTQKSINNVKRLIATIDKPTQQVLIEARVVEASDKFLHEVGIRWGGGFNTETGRNFPGAVAVGAGKPGSNGPQPVGANPITTTGDNADAILNGGTTSTGGRGFLVDLPATVGTGLGGAVGLSLGSFSKVLNLDLELSAAEADGDVKIISNPRVMATNLQKATIEKGRDVPFVSTSQNGTQVQFKKATLSIEVTPQITADKHVIMKVLVTKDSVSPDQNAGQQILDVQKVETEVFMNNGETVVIGGVYTRNKSTSINGIPLLMDIPYLGWLFKKRLIKDDKAELLIFLTPKIMDTSLARGEENP